MNATPNQDGLAAQSRGRPLAHAVLELIWHERQLSRAEISRRTGLSRSTVSDIISGLLATGLIAEVGAGPSAGGRRPVMLGFQDDANIILGIDMGATHVSVAVIDLRGRILAWTKRAHPVRTDPEGTEVLMSELAAECLAEWGGSPELLLGIGIAVPSPVDPLDPGRLSTVVLPAWDGRKIGELLSSTYDRPVFVDNDASLGALAERWWGGAANIDDFAYLKIATGIGAGYLIRGRIYRGSAGVAGEIGHLSVDPNGAPCVCGNRGCLATLVGTPALFARIEELLPEFPDSVFAGSELSVDRLKEAATAGDPLAEKVVREVATHLGNAIAGVLNLMNPGAVILGGSLARLGEILLIPLRAEVRRRTLVSSVAAAEIRASTIGEPSIALGAGTYVLASALDDPRLFPGVAS